MALSRDFKATVAARVQGDPAFTQALLDEAITLFIDGEPDTAKLSLLKDTHFVFGCRKSRLDRWFQ